MYCMSSCCQPVSSWVRAQKLMGARMCKTEVKHIHVVMSLHVRAILLMLLVIGYIVIAVLSICT